MRAMLLRQPRPIDERPLELVELPRPHPGPGEILIAVNACGVCHTDLHVAEGELPPHTLAGRARAPDRGPRHRARRGRDRAPGRRPRRGALAELGRRHVPLLSPRRREPLRRRAGSPAGTSTAATPSTSWRRRRSATRSSKSSSDLAAAPLLCAGIIGYRSLRLSGLVPWGHGREAAAGPAGAGAAAGRRLGLYGFGAAAHLCLQVARYWGAEVYAFTREEKHRRLARELGAVWAGASGEAPGGDPERQARRGDHLRPGRRPGDRRPPGARQGWHRRHGRHLLVAGAGDRVSAALPRARDAQRHELDSPRCRRAARLAAAIPITTEIQVFRSSRPTTR